MPATESNYRIDHHTTYSSITLLPGLNNAQWSDIEQAGREITSRLNGMRTPAVLVDLTPLNYMGSAMVAMIVRCWKNVQANKGRIVVVCNNDVVRDVISLAGLTKVWPMVETREEAMHALGVSSSGGNLWFVVVGMLAVLTGGVGAGLLLAEQVSPPVALGLLFSGAGVGFMIGLVMLIRSSLAGRFWGLGFVLAGVAIAILGFLNLPQAPAADATPPAEEASAEAATAAQEAAESSEAADPAEEAPGEAAVPDEAADPDETDTIDSDR